jgi:hypothetical protein
MGDHVPDFILRSFRIDSPATDDAEDDTPETEAPDLNALAS